MSKKPSEMTIGELRKTVSETLGLAKPDVLKMQKEELVAKLEAAEAPSEEAAAEEDWGSDEPAAEAEAEKTDEAEGSEEVEDAEEKADETEEAGAEEAGETEAAAEEKAEDEPVADYRANHPKFASDKLKKANEFRKKWADSDFSKESVPGIAKELGFGKAEAPAIMSDFCDTCGTQAPADEAKYVKVGNLKRCVLCHNEKQSATNSAEAKAKGKAAKGEKAAKVPKERKESAAPRKKQAGADGTAFSYHGGEDGFRASKNTRSFAHQTLSGQHVTDAEAKSLLQTAHARFTAHYSWCSLRDLVDMGLATQERKDGKQAFKIAKYDGDRVEYVPPQNPLNAGRPAKGEPTAAE